MANAKQRAQRKTATRKTASKTSTPKATATKNTYNDASSPVTFTPITADTFKQDATVETRVNSGVTYNPQGGRVTLPGIQDDAVTFDSITGRIRQPGFVEIGDITKPNISDDRKCDERTKNAAIAEYDQAINYEQVAQKYNQYVGEQYKTLTEAYKAYNEGLKSLAALEKVKQQFVEVLKQQGVTQEKIVGYVDQAHKLAVAKAKLPYSVAEREAQLSEAKSKAMKAYHSAEAANEDALTFINGLLTSDTGANK